jgi:dihydroorotase
LYDLIIRDGTIVSSTGRLVADIAVEDGKIAYVGGNPGGGAREEVSAIGCFVIPGVVDSHVHFRDPGHPHKESWLTGSRDAVRGGITTVFDMPNTDPPTLDERAVRGKLEIAGSTSVANYGVWAGTSSSNLDQLADLWDQGLVCATKVFMGDSTGALAIDLATLEGVFRKSKGLIGVHAEDQDSLAAAKAKWTGTANPIHNDVRPPESAVLAVRTLIELVQETRRHVHICHVSTAMELQELEPHRGDLPITCEVAAHHLFLSVENGGNQGNFTKVNPPIRTELDRRALWTAVKRGWIDSFASDHAPHTREEKEQPYWDAPAGVPGVGTLLPLLLAAVKNGRVGCERLVQMCCEMPAHIFSLADKGRIAVGYDADLVLFREGVTTRYTEEMVQTRCGWSPFIGKEIAVPPDRVYVQGRLASEKGVLQDDLPPGRQVVYIRD